MVVSVIYRVFVGFQRSNRCGEEAQAAKTRQEFGPGDEFVSLWSRAAPGGQSGENPNKNVMKFVWIAKRFS